MPEKNIANENGCPIISLSNVTINQQRDLLTEVNMEVNPGDFLYLIGKTGTGKTSLLRTLYADLPLEGGEAFVCGFPLHNLKSKQVSVLRRELGIVFQDFQLLTDRTVFGNLAFVLKVIGWKNKNEIEQRVAETLDAVGILEKAQRPAHQLSEGEMQRVSIARALVNKPKLILADEPTGNLDPITSEEIVQLLRKINQENQTTVLMATHDYIMIEKYPEKVLCCDNGKLVV